MPPDQDSNLNGNANRDLNEAANRNPQVIRILHVEDDPTVAGLVQEIAKDESWEVGHCIEGNAALKELVGPVEYDLLLMDYEVPGLNGLELIERVRSMFHREYVPIVMTSGTLDGAEARKAGANAFLRKPEDIGLLVETVNRLLDDRKEKAGGA